MVYSAQFIYIYIEYENNLDLLLGIQNWRRFIFVDKEKQQESLNGENRRLLEELIGGKGNLEGSSDYGGYQSWSESNKYENFSRIGIDMSSKEPFKNTTYKTTGTSKSTYIYIYIYII